VRAENLVLALPWRAFFGLLVPMFAMAIGFGIVLPIMPFLVEGLVGVSDAAAVSRHTGLLTGAYTAALFLFAPLWGELSDRYGRRRLILGGLAGLAVTLALSAVLRTLPFLYVGRFLAGLFASAIAPCAYAVVADYAPSREWRAHRFALLGIAGMAGFLVGPLLGGLVLGAAGFIVRDAPFSTPFLAASIFAFAALFVAWLLLPIESRATIRRDRAGTTKPDQAIVIRLLCVAFVTAAAVGAFEVGLALRGKQILGSNAYQIGMMFTECSLVMFAVQAVVFSPLVKPEATRCLFIPALLTLAAGLLAVPLTLNYLTMAIAVASIAASAGILSPIATYWISLLAGHKQGAALGGQTAVASLGQTLGSAVGGVLFEVSFLPHASFTVTALLVLAAVAATAGLARRLKSVVSTVPLGGACAPP
jgi:DHA1 family multidrug resistance protein-like MFS transporter